jgi:RNA-directed DNA polymerase
VSSFDRIGHDHLMAMLGCFPARGMVRQWLKAGVVEHGRLHRTEEGTPQGGVASPLLLNIALHGIETAAGVRYLSSGSIRVDSPALIRYADDFVVHCHTRQDAIEVKARLAAWLAPRGLSFSEQKTRVVSLEEGYDFLGFNVRRYRSKPMIKPSKAAVRRIRQRLREELWSLRGSNAIAVIRRLNPIIRGWAAYYRTQVTSVIFGKLDHYLWRLVWKWAKFSHPTRPKRWIHSRYFGRFNKARQDWWVFGDRASGAYLHKFGWTHIIRHQLVKHRASPDDPTLREYWARRRQKTPLPINPTLQRLHVRQDGRCAICNGTLYAEQPHTTQGWEQWLHNARTPITVQVPSAAEQADYRLIHADCHHGSHPAPLNAHTP